MDKVYDDRALCKLKLISVHHKLLKCMLLKFFKTIKLLKIVIYVLYRSKRVVQNANVLCKISLDRHGAICKDTYRKCSLSYLLHT